MSSRPTAPPSVSADGGGDHPRPPRGQHRRRARNRRYRRNRQTRSLLHIVVWNAEGIRSKIPELQGWLRTAPADVIAIQEAQFPAKTATRIPGFQPPVITRRARGRREGAAVTKGGDVAIYLRAGLHFTPLTDRPLDAADDSSEVCGVRILGERPLTVWNLYRPPIRSAEDDDRRDRFSPDALPHDDQTIVVGDLNGHHPLWDSNCETADPVGQRFGDWLDRVGWTTLNSGAPTFMSYRTGSRTAPDVVACSSRLARSAQWRLGPDLGSDHLPMLVELGSSDRSPPE